MNGFEDIINELKSQIKKIDQAFDDIDTDEIKAQAKRIKEKGEQVLEGVVVKLQETKEKLDDDELEKTVNYIKERTEELVKKTITKIDELKKTEIVDDLIENIDEFINKPQVQETIEKAKDITEKGVNALKSWLNSESRED